MAAAQAAERTRQRMQEKIEQSQRDLAQNLTELQQRQLRGATGSAAGEQLEEQPTLIYCRELHQKV
jgi:hypothetical protein